jgi:hypothetical protein
MKTKTASRVKIILTALEASGEWMSTACISSQCRFPPECIHRESYRTGDCLTSAKSSIVSQACYSAVKCGHLESRKTRPGKHEYKITNKGKLHLMNLKARETMTHNKR